MLECPACLFTTVACLVDLHPLDASMYVFVLHVAGIGVCMFVLSAGVSVYYHVLISWCFYYIASSFSTDVPWRFCDEKWATEGKAARGGH